MEYKKKQDQRFYIIPNHQFKERREISYWMSYNCYTMYSLKKSKTMKKIIIINYYKKNDTPTQQTKLHNCKTHIYENKTTVIKYQG